MDPKKIFTTPLRIYAAVFVAGLLMPLAFAPYNYFPLALLSVSVLFLIWQYGPARQAAIAGLLFGIASFGVSSIWVLTSFIVHVKISPILSVAIFSIFLVIFAGHIAIIGWLQVRFRHINVFVRFCLLLPSLWVVAEITRSHLFTGYPFLLLGYSQLDTPLDNLAPYLGIYGLSFVSAFVAGLIALLLTRPAKWRIVTSGIAGIYIIGITLGTASWTRQSGAEIRIAMITGNMPSAGRWEKKNRQPILDHFWDSTQKYSHVDAIFWPETALPVVTDRIPEDYREKLSTFARQTNTDIVMGVAEGKIQDGRYLYYNGVLNISDFENIYRKRKLIPFLEFYPLKFGRKFLKRFINIPMSDYQSGAKRQPPILIAGQPAAPTICYEDAFPHLAAVKNPRISIMVNLSEDGWFANTTAIPQRVQISRMRAKENERYFIRVSNNGTSAVINHKGQILKSNIGNPRQSFEAVVQPRTGMTPYMMYGDKLILGIIAVIMLGLFWPDFKLFIQRQMKKD